MNSFFSAATFGKIPQPATSDEASNSCCDEKETAVIIHWCTSYWTCN